MTYSCSYWKIYTSEIVTGVKCILTYACGIREGCFCEIVTIIECILTYACGIREGCFCEIVTGVECIITYACGIRWFYTFYRPFYIPYYVIRVFLQFLDITTKGIWSTDFLSIISSIYFLSDSFLCIN